MKVLQGTLIIIILSILLCAPTCAHASDTKKVNMLSNDILTLDYIKPDQKRVIVLDGPVRDGNMKVLSAALKSLATAPKTPAYLVINSPGGSLDAGMEFINAMVAAKDATGLKTSCVITGRAYSMAAIIASYCHETWILPNADMMFHDMSYGAQGPHPIVQARIAYMARYADEVESNLARQLGITLNAYKELKKNELWLTAREAAAKGFVNGIVGSFFFIAEPPKEENILTIFFDTFKFLTR